MAEPAASQHSLAAALAARPITLDGGLSTELARQGHDVSSALWSARLLRDDPAAVTAAHAAFLRAGAQVATTASYQATFDGFARQGIDVAQATALLRRSVELARQAQEETGTAGRSWVAASVGPYGAMLADGSEYTGSYVGRFWPGRAGGGLTAAELRAFHRPRLDVLAQAGPDVLACETVPCLVEAEALVTELSGLGYPGWLSLTTVTTPGGEVRTRRDEPAAEAFAMARDVDAVIGVGVNCTDPRGVKAAVALAAKVSGKPVIAYPNTGERWDAAARSWVGEPGLNADDVDGWAAAGARLIGGCCRVGPDMIHRIAERLEQV